MADPLATSADTRRADTPLGTMSVFADDLIARHLDRYGEWAPFETMLALSLLQPGQTVLDAGAYVGTFGLSILTSDPKRVIAVEANAQTLGCLQDNAARLGEGRIRVVHGALGLPADVTMQQQIDPNNRGGATFSARQHGGASSVPRLTLAELRGVHGDYHLAKLDLEGCELQALLEEQDYLHRAKPVLMIEANDTPETCQIANYCRWLGYKVAYADMPIWRDGNPKGATEAIFHLAHEAMLIAMPPGLSLDCPDELLGAGGRLIPIADTHDLVEALWRTPRWASKAWLSMSREELVAVLGRLSRSQTRGEFQAQLFPKTLLPERL